MTIGHDALVRTTGLEIVSSDELASLVIQGWVHIQLEVILQQPSKTLQDAAIQVSVMLLFEQLLQTPAHFSSNRVYGCTKPK